MVTPDAPDEENFRPVGYEMLSRAAQSRRRGLLRRFALFASGVNVKLLNFVPSEEGIYSVLGSSIIVTTVVATIASGVAIGFLVRGDAFIGVVPVVGGIGFGLLIFMIDRLLVKAPLNPYSFEPEVLHALWNPSADARWYDVLTGQIVRGRRARRLNDLAATFLKATPRFLIAIATSFVFAEITLFMIFSGEVTVRAQAIQQQQQQQQIDELNATYHDKRQQLQNAVTAEAGSDDPVLSSLNQRLQNMKSQLKPLSSDTQKLGEAVTDETDGIKASFTLSDGTVITTTGQVGVGQGSRTLVGEYNSDSAQLSQLRSQIASLTRTINRRKSSDAASASGPIKTLEAQETALDKQHANDLKKLESGTGPVKGILIREQALNQLAGDMDPSTIAVNPPPPCSSGFGGAWCHTVRFFVEPTPLGPFVAAFRLFFISVELLPILMKIVLSLRRRRPYDALTAAIEEISVASSIELLDNILVQVGAMLESRASWRKAQRSGAGAEFILAAASRAGMGNDELNNALAAALGKRFKRRIRLWPRRRKSPLDSGRL